MIATVSGQRTVRTYKVNTMTRLNQLIQRRLHSRKNSTGFTLIELVIVVVILGILSAIAIPSYGNIQNAARFERHNSDLRYTVQLLEIYKADNGTYPVVNGWSFQTSNPDVTLRNNYIPGLVPNYTSELPLAANSGAQYIYKSNGVDYKIMRYNANGIPTGEWKQVPDALKDPNGKTRLDRYGYWTKGYEYE